MEYRILRWILFLVVVPAAGFAQAQPIPQSDYWAAIRSSNDKAQAIPHRKVVTEQSFEGGVRLRSLAEVYEYLPPDSFKQTQHDYYKGSRFTDEFIRVGNVYYCRKQGEEWTKSDTWCGPRSFRSIPANAKVEFSRETIGIGSDAIYLYRTYATYTLEGQNPNEERFYERKSWIDSLGRITKDETRMGTVESNHRLHLTSTLYEYDPAKLKIEIEAPIK
jgi:hypothetical protein